jgi:hypothetical protein
MKFFCVDIHSIEVDTGLMDQIESDQYADKDRLYILITAEFVGESC